MGKIRIYELAKELGVDNRVVINKATELGFEGKASHSNTLEDHEADAIRRAIIRQAIGENPDKEVVRQRVDKVTGEKEAIVEKRKGNVIRRRKQAVDEAPESEAASPAAATAQESVFADTAREAATEEPASVEMVATGAEPAADESIATAEAIAEEAVPAEAEAAAVPGEDGKKGVGPRVLGKIELPQRRAVKVEAKRPPTVAGPAVADVPVEDEEGRDGRRGGADKRAKGRKREFLRSELVDYEGREMRRIHKAGKPKQKDSAEQSNGAGELTTPKASKRIVEMGETITVGELAHQMSVKAGELIRKLMELGALATINQALDKDTATIVAEEFGFQVQSTTFDETTILTDEAADLVGNTIARPPVVTVMGHVDHGKTTLLDSIRDASVASGEAGGITQHIGAYQVSLPDNRKITFIDTPGHAAFTAMRARGAKVTDIVILVVAADDGVMPQTLEAINHAKAAEVPIIVAVNKIDKPGINPDRIKQQLAEHGLQPEEWGGDTMFFPVSALKKQGIKELLEGVLLVAEMKELKSNPDRRAKGTIVESRQERGLGTVATVLVQHGTLRVGDVFVSGAHYGRVKSIVDYRGEKMSEAGPSTPVEITGLSDVPEAGDDFFVVESEAKAKDVSLNRTQKLLAAERALASGPISLEEFSRRAQNQPAQELNVIIKADVHGSVEAVREALEKLSTDKVKVRVLHAAIGGVSESDVQLAIASQAMIIGFNVRSEPRASTVAEESGVEIRFYRIIYELIDDVKKAMVGLLAPIRKELPLGRVEVRETFVVPKVGTIAGCFVADGMVRRGALLRLVRDSKVVYEGKMGSLRRFKEDVREVQSGFECGIGIEGYNDVKSGDVLEVYEVKEQAATLE